MNMNMNNVNYIEAIEFERDKLVSFLNDNSVDYALLGNPTGENILKSDLDLCTFDCARFEEVFFKYCEINQYRIINSRLHSTGIRYDYLIKVEGQAVIFPGPDILLNTLFKIRGDIGLSYHHLLSRKILSDSLYFKPANVDDFVFYFIKRIDKNDISKNELSTLIKFFSGNEVEIIESLGGFFSSDQCELIHHGLLKGFLSTSFVNELHNHLRVKSKFTIRNYLYDIKRIPSRIVNPTGLIIVFLGVDGSGKTTIGNGIKSKIAPIFNGIINYHLRPYFIGNSGNGMIVTDPHGEKNRALLTSLLKLIYFLFDYSLGYMFKSFPLKLKSNLVIFDRYYHDILVDPKRYRYGGPKWCIKLIEKMIPNPDLFIILDAPAEVVQARKKEVSLYETQRQREAYLEFARSKNNCIVLDTSGGVNETINEGFLEIIEYMSERQEKRINKK